MTTKEIQVLVRRLSDRDLHALICEANAEDRRRFDKRCAAHPANRKIRR